MKQYQIYIQGNFYSTIEAKSVSSVILKVSKDIDAGLVPNLDKTQDLNLKIVPVSDNNSWQKRKIQEHPIDKPITYTTMKLLIREIGRATDSYNKTLEDDLEVDYGRG